VLRRRRLRLPLTPLYRRLGGRLASRPAAQASPDPEPWWAGVAAILTPDPDSILLIRRAERADDPWSGHVGLPGGRHAPTDPDLLATAVRETREEVGITLPPDALLGVLDDVAPRTPLARRVAVRPYVFALPNRPPLTLSGEVAEAHWLELERLRDQGVYRDTVLSVRGERRSFPAYHVGPLLIWGLTERILTLLLSIIY
jgi:8-oxo-dGTP pyrophosphatase MutT (NUDIX family)